MNRENEIYQNNQKIERKIISKITIRWNVINADDRHPGATGTAQVIGHQ